MTTIHVYTSCANPHCRHLAREHFNLHDCMLCRCSRFRPPAKPKNKKDKAP